MKVVIIEDEKLVAKDLLKLLTTIDPGIQIEKQIESVVEAKKYFTSNPMPDLIFADIQLADGVSFDIFADTTINCPIIFTTAYDQYAVAAFKFNSIDYLLKPIDEHDLRHAIEKFKRSWNTRNTDEMTQHFRAMLQQLRNADQKNYKSRFTGHFGKSIVAIPEEQIAYFTKDEIIFLITLENKQILTDYSSLEELEELVNPEKFIRANRQYIVNINAIDNIKSHFTGKLHITLKDPLKAELVVSREKAGEFKKWFEGN